MTQLTLNKGSDLRFEIVWPSAPGDDAPPANITGHTLDLFECTPVLQSNMTVSIGNAANGQIIGRITWNNAFPVGRQMSFILRKFDGIDRIALPAITVNVVG